MEHLPQCTITARTATVWLVQPIEAVHLAVTDTRHIHTHSKACVRIAAARDGTIRAATVKLIRAVPTVNFKVTTPTLRVTRLWSPSATQHKWRNVNDVTWMTQRELYNLNYKTWKSNLKNTTLATQLQKCHNAFAYIFQLCHFCKCIWCQGAEVVILQPLLVSTA